VGHLPVDVQSIQCDFLSGTGRKFLRGPRGSGFLYCRRDSFGLLEPATLDNTGATWVAADAYELHPTARRFERYEMSFASKVGLGLAVEECLQIGIESIWERIQNLAENLRQGLKNVPGVRLMDRGAHLCGIVTFVKQGLDAAEIQSNLMIQKGINTSVSRVASSRLEFEARALRTAVVRASLHVYNIQEEIDSLIEFVRTME
jgi:selenocysteine lyase/cysteine desulfurase